MKKTLAALLIATICLVTLLTIARTRGADTNVPQVFEYATIRWGGRENTHLIRPSGSVEFIGSQFLKVKRPDRADERSFFMNIAMNALAKEGFEFAGMTNDEIVMKRNVAR